MNIPDLRIYNNEVTLEHCSVLQERLGRVLEEAYPGQDLNVITNNNFDPERMREEILEIFTLDAFMNLFNTEMGKGVLIGAFLQEYVLGDEDES